MAENNNLPVLPTGGQLDAIDGIRGLLAFWVFLGHLAGSVYFSFPILSRPGLAVDFFMLLSGFLMMWHWTPRERIHPSKLRQSLDFYIRRFFRIAPLYYFVFFVFLIFPEPFNAAKAGIADAFFKPCTYSHIDNNTFKNIALHCSFFFGMLPKYAQNNPLPDWSLSLEMQFYIVFPLLVAVSRRINFLAFSMALFPMALVFYQFFGVPNAPGILLTFPQPSFLPMRIATFVSGIILAEMLRSSLNNNNRASPSLTCAFIIALSVCDKYVILGSAFIAYLLLSRNDNPVLRLLESRPVKFLGSISYSVYLTHIPVLLLVLWGVSQTPVIPKGHSGIAFLISALIISPILIAVSYLTYAYIEKPGINLGRKFCSYLMPRTNDC